MKRVGPARADGWAARRWARRENGEGVGFAGSRWETGDAGVITGMFLGRLTSRAGGEKVFLWDFFPGGIDGRWGGAALGRPRGGGTGGKGVSREGDGVLSFRGEEIGFCGVGIGCGGGNLWSGGEKIALGGEDLSSGGGVIAGGGGILSAGGETIGGGGGVLSFRRGEISGGGGGFRAGRGGFFYRRGRGGRGGWGGSNLDARGGVRESRFQGSDGNGTPQAWNRALPASSRVLNSRKMFRMAEEAAGKGFSSWSISR